MIPYPTKIPVSIQKLFKGMVWKSEKVATNELYLTFDDGPNLNSTPLICDILKQYDVKATFFLTGCQIERTMSALDKLRNDGHCIGNHGFEHIHGWRISKDKFLENMMLGHELTSSRIFRPPYGEITPGQYKLIKDRCHVVMWSIMPYDFLRRTSPTECVNRVIEHSSGGDIIVLHDKDNLVRKIQAYLKPMVEGLLEKGYTFGTIDQIIPGIMKEQESKL